VAHPVAGYSPRKVRAILGIPKEMQVITLVNVGKHAETLHDKLTDQQKEVERARPERLPFEKYAYIDRYQE
jgi:hypothetical protein